MKAIVLSTRIPNCRPCLRRGFFPLLLVCFGLAPMAQAVGPDTDGNIPGSNNGEGIGVLVSRTTGVWNTGTGFEALNHLTAGNQNTATGLRALTNDTNGGFNTATGVLSLFSNTSGFFNSATGAYSLANNTIGTHNTANGYGALYYNTASQNTATGFAALYRNRTGNNNVAVGFQALLSNTTGTHNTANGYRALFSNTTGLWNVADGSFALGNNIGGSYNTAVGVQAGAFITGSGNLCIGEGVFGVAGVDHTTWIRNIATTPQDFSAGVNNYVTVRMTDGRLGYTAVVSSRRYKEDIKPMDKASEVLLALKPVTFRLKGELDPNHRPQWGLIAEEVEKVNPDLVDRNNKGEVESVRYDAVNAMLLNEFLKEHRKVQELESSVAKQEATVAQQRKDFETATAQQHRDFQAKIGELEATIAAQLKEQAEQIQKVSAQIEASRSAPQVVLNNR